MRHIDLIKLSTRMFRTRRMRTMLTILGVSVGIGTIVFLVSLGYGLQKILLERITTSESLLSLDIYPPDVEGAGLDKKLLDDISSIQHVREVVPIATVPAQLAVLDSVSDTTGNVADSAYFRLSGIQPLEGKLFDENESGGIVISSTLAELFGWQIKDAVGKNVRLSLFYSASLSAAPAISAAAEIQGHSRDVIILGVVSGDSAFVYIPMSLYADLPNTYIAQAKVLVDSADNMEIVKFALEEERGLTVVALFDVVEQANKIFKALQITLAVFGAAALLVSAIGMFNTMTIAFLERTQEIGIMRAVGASHSDVFSMFVVESGLMGFLGGVGGLLIGFIAQFLFNFGLNMLARAYGSQAVDLFFTPLWFIAVIIIFSTAVGLLTGVFPGRRASKLNPLDALKYK